jgi:hypothetical protein
MLANLNVGRPTGKLQFHANRVVRFEPGAAAGPGPAGCRAVALPARAQVAGGDPVGAPNCRRYDRHLRRMRTIYARRRNALVDALASHAPDIAVTGLAAGFHAVVHPAKPARRAGRRLGRPGAFHRALGHEHPPLDRSGHARAARSRLRQPERAVHPDRHQRNRRPPPYPGRVTAVTSVTWPGPRRPSWPNSRRSATGAGPQERAGGLAHGRQGHARTQPGFTQWPGPASSPGALPGAPGAALPALRRPLPQPGTRATG